MDPITIKYAILAKNSGSSAEDSLGLGERTLSATVFMS